jgi:hypothetical protein
MKGWIEVTVWANSPTNSLASIPLAAELVFVASS